MIHTGKCKIYKITLLGSVVSFFFVLRVMKETINYRRIGPARIKPKYKANSTLRCSNDKISHKRLGM